MGLIANSQCFIGSSLHGCITAMSYCKPYLGVEVSKTLNYIKDWGLGEDYCSECTDFYMKLSNALSCTPEVLKNNLNFQLNKSNENFKNIEKILVD